MGQVCKKQFVPLYVGMNRDKDINVYAYQWAWHVQKNGKIISRYFYIRRTLYGLIYNTIHPIKQKQKLSKPPSLKGTLHLLCPFWFQDGACYYFSKVLQIQLILVFCIFTGVKLIYNIVLVLDVQHNDSVFLHIIFHSSL